MDKPSKDGDELYPVHAPGWTALDKVLGAVYPGQTPHQYTSKHGYDLDSRSPLPAISVCEAGGPDHWHFVTYGLTELFEKSSKNAELSGFGYEVTLRLPRTAQEAQPPAWALSFLQAIGHYVLSGSGVLDSGHIIDLGGSLMPAHAGDTLLRGVVVLPDPTFGKVDTPFGSVLFLQLYGLTQDELTALSDWDMERKVGLVQEIDRLAITDPARAPLAQNPRTAAIFRRYALKVMI